MTINAALIKPGHVLVSSGGDSLVDKGIQIAAILQGDPAAEHMAVVHHKDKVGRWIGVEGRPGGVGWVDCSSYIGNALTVANLHQVIQEKERYEIAVLMEAMLGTPYDWQAIVEDGGMAFGLPDIWTNNVDGKLPGHIVCSALAAYGYDKYGVAAPSPKDYRHVSPGDWEEFILKNRFGG